MKPKLFVSRLSSLVSLSLVAALQLNAASVEEHYAYDAIGGLPIVSLTAEGIRYHLYDNVGTTLASYTADGKLVATYKATAFGKGEELQNSPAARFTGKPYDADLGAYVFPFRNYKPELARWMSADPAGFPDGPNSHSYVPVPNMSVDPWGLWRTETPYGGMIPPTHWSDKTFAESAPLYFWSRGFGLSGRAVEHLIGGKDETIPDIVLTEPEQNMFVSDSAFMKVRDAVHNHVEMQNGRTATFGSNFFTNIKFVGKTDLYFSIHDVKVYTKGSLTPTYVGTGSNGWYSYSGDLTVSFEDTYDFRIGDNAFVNVFARLEKYGWTSSFDITGSWKVNFDGSFPER